MKKILPSLPLALSYFLFTTPILAQDTDSIVGKIEAPGTIVKDIGDTTNFISVIIQFITVIAGLYALWQLVTGGFGYITSGGDKSKIQQSTQQIMMSIMGLVIIGASFILADIVGRLLFGGDFHLLAPILKTVTPITP